MGLLPEAGCAGAGREGRALCVVVKATKVYSFCKFVEMESLLSRFPAIAADWHTELNGTLEPKDVAPFSNRRVFWQCPTVEHHNWSTTVGDRSSYGTGCPICAGKKVCPCGCNSLLQARPLIAEQWNTDLNSYGPDKVTYGSNKKVFWTCDKDAHHIYYSAVSSRTSKGRPSACPICSGRTICKLDACN